MKKKRSGMTVFCSRDGGKTWPSHTEVNGDSRGGYSDIVETQTTKQLLMVWEDGEGNFNAEQVSTGFCKK